MSIFADPVIGNDSFMNLTTQPIQQNVLTQEQHHQNKLSQPFIMTSQTQQQYFEALSTAATLHQMNSFYPAFNSYERAAAVLNTTLLQFAPPLTNYMNQFCNLQCSNESARPKYDFISRELRNQVRFTFVFKGLLIKDE